MIGPAAFRRGPLAGAGAPVGAFSAEAALVPPFSFWRMGGASVALPLTLPWTVLLALIRQIVQILLMVMILGLRYRRTSPPIEGLSAKPLGSSSMKVLLTRFVEDESGATAIEYGLIAAGISVAIITVVGTLGSSLKTTFTSVQTAIK